MTVSLSIDSARLLEEQLAQASPDPRRRDELVGSLKTKPGLRRYLRRTGSGLLRIDVAAIKHDGKWLLRTSDATLTAEDLAAAYKQLIAAKRSTSMAARPQSGGGRGLDEQAEKSGGGDGGEHRDEHIGAGGSLPIEYGEKDHPGTGEKQGRDRAANEDEPQSADGSLPLHTPGTCDLWLWLGVG